MQPHSHPCPPANDFHSDFWKEKTILLDSRKQFFPKHTIFWAFQGARHDSHNFIPDLYKRGARFFVVHKWLPVFEELTEANFRFAEDAVKSLQAFAQYWRTQFSIPIIGITGSNGKTTIKEWLFRLLEKKYHVVKNPKSYNSQIGVPLSLLEIRTAHNLGIFEAGISTIDEMEKLQAIIRPQIGIFTNIGEAHSEGFSGETEKIQEKLKLFKNTELLIYCIDHQNIHKQIQQSANKSQKHLHWGKQADAVVRITAELTIEDSTQIDLDYNNTPYRIQIPFKHRASVENCMHCVTLLLYWGWDIGEIQQRLQLLHALPMRLEWKKGINGCMLIDDTYNNDLAGLRVALDFFEQKFAQNTKYHKAMSKTIILSDMLEMGIDVDVLYKKVARLIEKYNIQTFIGIGEKITRYKNEFQTIPNHQFYSKTQDFVHDFHPNHYKNSIILIKGARTFELDGLVHLLQYKTHYTRLEINLQAIAQNFNYYRSLLKKRTKTMAMVKAFAYGSGSGEIARVLQYHHVDYLGVAYTDEGVTLRKSGITTPIMVMNAEPQSFDSLVHYNLEPAIGNLQILKRFIDFVAYTDNGSGQKIHLELDTGMRRLGFDEKNIEEVCALLKNNPQSIEVQSIFTHLAAADEGQHDDFSNQQHQKFLKLSNYVCERLQITPIRHILNSSGISRFPHWQFDMVRLGIGLHGIDPNGWHQQQLKPVATFKTTISQIHHLKAGESVGYGRQGRLDRNAVIATIAVGYADGFSRGQSKGIGKVWVNGHIVPIVGNICMDMCFIDITDIPANQGDEVILFGEKHPITHMAKALKTIPYEILTMVSNRVPRIFYEE